MYLKFVTVCVQMEWNTYTNRQRWTNHKTKARIGKYNTKLLKTSLHCNAESF